MKFIDAIPGTGRARKHYQYTDIDDCTRLRVLPVYPRADQKTSIEFMDYVLSRLPFHVEEFYRLQEVIVIDDSGLFEEKPRDWEDHKNYQRPQGDLDGQTLCERLLQRTKTQVVTNHRQSHT